MDLSTTTTESLIATIANDHDDIVTFYARVEFTDRCGTRWQKYAPVRPRSFVHAAAGIVVWDAFLDEMVWAAAAHDEMVLASARPNFS